MFDRLDEKSNSWPFLASQATARNSQAASISRMDIGNTVFTEISIRVKAWQISDERNRFTYLNAESFRTDPSGSPVVIRSFRRSARCPVSPAG